MTISWLMRRIAPDTEAITFRRSPTLTLEECLLLRFISACTVMPCCCAMDCKVSPRRTVWTLALVLASGVLGVFFPDSGCRQFIVARARLAGVNPAAGGRWQGFNDLHQLIGVLAWQHDTVGIFRGSDASAETGVQAQQGVRVPSPPVPQPHAN